MKRQKQFNGSAAEVEAAFYDALNRADLTALMALWADDEDIACIHPGGARLIGHAAIHASWASMFEHGGLSVAPMQLHQSHNVMSAIHTVIEDANTAGGQEAHLLTTNVYLKTPRGWRMVLHHASVAPGSMPKESKTLILH